MTPVTQALSTALLHFIWQGIAGGIVLAIALLLLRKSSASSRYVASCLVLGRARPVAGGYGLDRVSVFAGSFSRSRDRRRCQKRRKSRGGRRIGICCALSASRLRSVGSALMGCRRDRLCAPAGVGQWSCFFVAAPRCRGRCIDSVDDSEPGGTRGDPTHDSCVDVFACGSTERGRMDSPGGSSSRCRCRWVDASATGSSDRP